MYVISYIQGYVMLLENIQQKNITVSVIGLGYVGLPLAVRIADQGMKVFGVDISESRVSQLAKGESYVDDISNDQLAVVLGEKGFTPTTDASVIAQSNVVIMCVPTPLTKHKEPDVSYIKAAGKTVGAQLQKDSLVILESTTYPGTTEEVLKPLLEEESGLVCGKDFYLAFAPERIDPGNEHFEFYQIPKVVGGIDETHTDHAVAFYHHILESVYPVSNTRVAEMTKLLENIYRLVNISMINEMALLAGKMNIDIWEVIEAAKTKPYGFQAFYPGPGAGGHCIPLDPFYLAWKAKEYDFTARFISLAGDINYRMPEYALSKIAYALNQAKKPLNGSKVLVLGVAYKKDIGDARESSIVRLISLLRKKHADVRYYDPHLASIHLEYEDHQQFEGLTDVDIDQLKEYDVVIIGTAHSGLDYDLIAEKSNLIVDLQNAITDHSLAHVYRF